MVRGPNYEAGKQVAGRQKGGAKAEEEGDPPEGGQRGEVDEKELAPKSPRVASPPNYTGRRPLQAPPTSSAAAVPPQTAKI